MTGARRVAVVMAASRGLGRACAEALADEGLDLVVCARGAEALEATAEELRGRGVAVTTVLADLSIADDVARVVTTAQQAYGRLDVLVVNAGGPPAGTFGELDDAAFEAGFQLTQMSAIRAIRAAVPLMDASDGDTGAATSSGPRGGRIVIMGSSSVRSPIGHLVVSNTYRPGLNGLVKSLAVELAPRGITVNMVSPGKIATDRLRSMEERVAAERSTTVEDVRRSAVARIPAGRLGEPRELGDAVAYLTSERAAYVTGQSLLVDGGMVPNLP